ncbi:uncharacterized protein LOC126694999 [Quercus robur]|uniref:uncharacterized protein LOC126694999 n=1 Tax=Quercus robur TaxID=38942 RepID=UPI002163E742|nr:uncharacterized protein LOC126694999 [Quercus robur]
MYVTRPLSMFQKNPSALSWPPPEGPNSGILVIEDEEAEQQYTCFGLCKSDELKDLPFPQNKNLKLRYSSGVGENQHVSYFYANLIPVLNQPLSSNRYYVIKRRGSHKGEAYQNSKEDDMGNCFCFKYVSDVTPKPLDPNDIHQQFEIHRIEKGCQGGGFVAKPITPDGFPPKFLGRKGWEVHTSTPSNFRLGNALGLDSALRARLPEFNFPLSCTSSQLVVVGKWYSPFMFIKEGTLKDQISTSMYYELTLEQKWEQIFACENNGSQGNVVDVDVVLPREVVSVAGREVVDVKVVNGIMWFKGCRIEGQERSVGLSLEVFERMKWEQERFGWVGGSDIQVSLKRVDEFGGIGRWGKFGCYILAERFVLKRMDGSRVLTYEFNHINKIQSKWE